MPSGPAPGSSRRHRWADRALRVSLPLLRALYIGTALLGLLVTPPVVVLLLVPGLAVTAVVLLAGFIWYIEQHWPTRRTLTTTATATAALIPFGQAVQALQSVGSAISLGVLVLLTVAAIGWLARQPAPAARPAVPVGVVDRETGLREVLRVMPLETLLAEWRALSDLGPGADLSAAATARALLLDELQRRDPVGFSAWLGSGATRPPDAHFCDGRGLAP